jgi:hypothetical protein
LRGQRRWRARREHDVKLEREKLSGQPGKTFKSAFGPSRLVCDVPPLFVAELSHTLPKRIEERGICMVGVRGEETNTEYLSRLRLGRERRNEKTDTENDREPDPPHAHLAGGRLAGV